jgi:hypothetical protein
MVALNARTRGELVAEAVAHGFIRVPSPPGSDSG